MSVSTDPSPWQQIKLRAQWMASRPTITGRNCAFRLSSSCILTHPAMVQIVAYEVGRRHCVNSSRPWSRVWRGCLRAQVLWTKSPRGRRSWRDSATSQTTWNSHRPAVPHLHSTSDRLCDVVYIEADSDVILFHIYASWFLQPSCRWKLSEIFVTMIALKYALFNWQVTMITWTFS